MVQCIYDKKQITELFGGFMKSNFAFKKAEWIWIEKTVNNQYADFVSDFSYDGTGKVKFYVSAKTDYCLYINGRYAASGQYGDFPEMKSVDEIDVTPFLKTGKNRAAITAWSLDENTFSRIAQGFGVIFEAVSEDNVLLFSDENVLSRESKEYKSGEVYDINIQIGKGYVYTFEGEWKAIDSDISSFKKSVVLPRSCEFFIRPIKKLVLSQPIKERVVTRGGYIAGETGDLSTDLQTAFLSQRAETGNVFTADERADGVYFIVDLNKESVGFLHFELTTETPANIYVTYGEHLTDLRVRHKQGGRNFMLLHKNACGNVEFTSYMRRIGCRYLQFFVSAKRVTVTRATLIPTSYPVKERGFGSKRFFVGEIEKTAVYTLKQCMHEHYEDCPWREQAQYGMDSYLQILSGFYAFDNPEFVAAALRLFAHELNSENMLYITTPSRDKLFIPVFSAAFVLAVAAYVNEYGDFSVFEDAKDPIKKIIARLLSATDETGVIKRFGGWNFYEWTEGLDYTENQTYHAPITFFLIKALNDAAPLLKKAGERELADKYKALAKKTALSANAMFYDEEKKLYATYVTDGKRNHYAEYTQATAIYNGVADKKISRELCKTLSSENDLVKISLSNYLFKYCALLKTSSEYKKFVLLDIKKRWGKMLRNGATTFWETEKGEADFDGAGSLCHGWSAIPLYVINKYKLDE